LRALEHVDALKSEAPILGEIEPCDMNEAVNRRIEMSPKNLEEVIPELVDHLKGMFIWGHPRSQVNVVPPPSIPSIIGVLLTAIYNPNLTSEETSRRVAVAEVEAASMTAALLGYDPQLSTGLFTFGGTGTNLYAAKIGLEKALPGTIEKGVRERAVLIASGQSHYCRLSIAGWLGLGEENVVGVPTSLDNAMKIDVLEERMHKLLTDGVKIACIIATMGTTDAFGIDNLAAIIRLRDRLCKQYELDYTPHVHADAVIGWAWSVFNDYDFEENALEFRPRTVRALAQACHRIRHIHLADSVGIDFHKTGFAPYISSLFLVKDRADMKLITRERAKMPYLFQFGDHHPGQTTLETSRSGAGPMAALANLLLLGKDGLRTVLGHVVEMSEVLREELEGHPTTTVLNADNVGAVTLFRAYPDTIDSFTIKEQERCDASYVDRLRLHNEFNRRVFERLREDALTGQGVFLSLTDCYRHTDYGEPINALKSYILSPFSDKENIRMVVEKVLQTSKQVQVEMRERLE
jgi:glutamate/tyrosine decarboxylase-like PLP-dependent enzyme